ncbi:MAG: host attachment protein [Beijerinckiaceae bacterium]
MGEALMIPAGAWVLVADGRKALLLRNAGSARIAELEMQEVLEAPDNPPNRDQGTDRAPRTQYGTRRSAIEQTDWHQQAEDRFAADAAAALEARHRADPAPVILVAAPRTLAVLRAALPDTVRAAVAAEVAKTLTKHPVADIQRLLT